MIRLVFLAMLLAFLCRRLGLIVVRSLMIFMSSMFLGRTQIRFPPRQIPAEQAPKPSVLNR